VIRGGDVVNPPVRDDRASPIRGMSILDVEKAQKRS